MDRIYRKRSELRGAVVIDCCGTLYGVHGEGIASPEWHVSAEVGGGLNGPLRRRFSRGRTVIVLPVEYREDVE